MSARVLIVDDEAALVDVVARQLGKSGDRCTVCTSGDDALAALGAAPFDVVVTDLNMRGMTGLELCERVIASRPDVPVIVITAFGSLESAIGAIRAGAYDFITKPFDIEVLAVAIARAAQHRALREEVKELRRALDGVRRFDEIIGASSRMQKLFAFLDQIVESDASVLITGESGTGKEVVAGALHRRGRRKAGRFVAIDCAAIPEHLLESELFGHMRGAFTDARADRAGLLVQADGGTLFLDEIGELPLGMQAKLLRALEERRVRPVGADREVSFDTRVLAATNRDLEEAIAEQRFREDLYYRLDVLHVELPPLRSRGNDVLLLAQHFALRFAAQEKKAVTGISTAANERLLSYRWPGNVRELRNAIERAIAVTRFSEIVVEDLPERVRSYKASHVIVAGDNPTELATMHDVERAYILRVMEAVGGNKSLAARVLGFDRKTLYTKLDKYK